MTNKRDMILSKCIVIQIPSPHHVTTETHQREQEVKDQEWLRCLETEPFYPKKLFFKNLAPCVSTEFLVNYLKNITGQDCVDLLYSNEPGGVLATFKTELGK